MPWFHQTLQRADLVPTRLRENHVGKVIEEEGQVKNKSLFIFYSDDQLRVYKYFQSIISDVSARKVQNHTGVSWYRQRLHFERDISSC